MVIAAARMGGYEPVGNGGKTTKNSLPRVVCAASAIRRLLNLGLNLTAKARLASSKKPHGLIFLRTKKFVMVRRVSRLEQAMLNLRLRLIILATKAVATAF